MPPAKLRASFLQFAGQARYRKFVRSLALVERNQARLFFWQELLWREFATKEPAAPKDERTVMELLRVCDVHDTTLELLPIQPTEPEIRTTPEYDAAWDKHFPLASTRRWSCPECRKQRTLWITANHDLCRVLRCPITYEAYCEKFLVQISDPSAGAELRQKSEASIKKRSAEIAAMMLPGDELWEWDGGGWHQLSGRGGVAIVRDGKILQQWCLAKS
jgi:hypothetical protein